MIETGVRLIIAYNSLLIIGIVILVLVILTAWLSPRVHRHPTWYLFMASWLIGAFAFVLIIGQQTGPPPQRGLCHFQAALDFAAPML